MMKHVVPMSMAPFAQEIRVDDASVFINIGQDHDMVCISREQFNSFLYAITACANAKGWLVKEQKATVSQ